MVVPKTAPLLTAYDLCANMPLIAGSSITATIV